MKRKNWAGDNSKSRYSLPRALNVRSTISIFRNSSSIQHSDSIRGPRRTCDGSLESETMAEFIDEECEADSDFEIELVIDEETFSEKDFIDDHISDNMSVSDYRKADRLIDMGPDKPPVYLKDFTPGAEPSNSKVSCIYCNKLISSTNLSKHKKLCLKKRTFCTVESCRLWILTKDYETHVQNHSSIECKWCGKRILYEKYGEHEVEERLKELNEVGLEKNLKNLTKEYETNYVVWCKRNSNRSKTMLNWLQDKFSRGQIDEELMTYAKKKLSEKTETTNKPNKQKKETKTKTKTNKKKRKVNEDEDKENEPPEQNTRPGEGGQVKKCKPSQFFEVTMHLKHRWIFTTIVKYILSTFFDGYLIPTRFKKTWPLGSRSTTLFPHPAKWSLLQRTALQKKTEIRERLRKNVFVPKNFDRDLFKLKYFDYNMNPKKYFRKRFIRPIPFIQEWIAGKEYGLGAPLHCHMYIKTKEKMYINTVRRFFRRFKFLGTSLLENIATLKSPRDWMKYVTKEDYNAVVRNVDKERCNNNFIMWNFAKLSKDCNMSMYSNYRWTTYGQLNKYKEIHACYWEPIIKRQAYERAMKLLDPIQRIHIEKIVKLCVKTTIKGIYLWGEPKTGKSTTALAITKGAHFQVPEGNSTFALHSWKNEPFILFEDISGDQFLHFRNKINQLCDEHGLCFAQTKGGGSRLIQCEKVIVTSNYPPPTETEWPGFERRFLCIKYEKSN